MENSVYTYCSVLMLNILLNWIHCIHKLLAHVSAGLDHSRSLIHEHCKKLLLNLLLVMAAHNDHFDVAKIILSNRAINEDTALTLPQCGPRDRELRDTSFGGINKEFLLWFCEVAINGYLIYLFEQILYKSIHQQAMIEAKCLGGFYFWKCKY